MILSYTDTDVIFIPTLILAKCTWGLPVDVTVNYLLTGTCVRWFGVVSVVGEWKDSSLQISAFQEWPSFP